MEWQTVALIGGLLVPFLSGVVSVVISGELYRRHEERTAKIAVLQRLVSGRRALISGVRTDPETARAFFDALNEVFVRFRSAAVRDSLSSLLTAIERAEKADSDLFSLFKAMCIETGLPADAFAMRIFEKPFRHGASQPDEKTLTIRG
jgi:hypothetical protein